VAKKIIGAIDLGASGGKFIIGIFSTLHRGSGAGFKVEEVYRFENGPINLYLGSSKKPLHKMYWDDLLIYQEIIKALKIFSKQYQSLASLGIDTWGTDGAFYTSTGEMLDRVYNYRDHRLDTIRAPMFKLLPEKRLFELTGVPSMPFNMVNQLFWMAKHRPHIISKAKFFLPIHAIFYYYLCGARIAEYTWLSTTQLLDPYTKTWSKKVFKTYSLPLSLMPKIVPPGARIGILHREISHEIGLPQFPLIATATHDTASAYVACPLEDEARALIISSGTWSLVGKLIPSPIINDSVYNNHFTNEGGVGNIRFLKNVMGTWLIQELRRIWKEKDGKELSWNEIVALAQGAKPFYAFIDPDSNIFYNPKNMEEAIQKFCSLTAQPVPRQRRELLRICYESLALRYAIVNESIQELTSTKNEVVHIIGGGAKNTLLNQFTASSIGVPVFAGPEEATSIGNIIIQANTCGVIKSLREGRDIIRSSFPVKRFNPENARLWKEALVRFKKLLLKRKERNYV
jgi:rhamnulokinase